MASPAVFWETLRSRGIADAAPLFVQAGVVSLSEVQGSWQKLLDAGTPRWQLEVLLAGPQRTRVDFATVAFRCPADNGHHSMRP